MPNAPIPYTYATLVQAMQDWPVNQGANYIANIPQFVSLGELRLLRDLNLEFFDLTDATQVLAAGANEVTKPTGIVSLRTMRLAIATPPTVTAPDPVAIGASQFTTQELGPLAPTGTLGPSLPITLAVPLQVTVTDTTSVGNAGGIIVTITGKDSDGSKNSETIYTENGRTVIGKVQWASITGMTCSGGGTLLSISIGTAEGGAQTGPTQLGKSYPVYKRNFDYVSNYASNPARTARPRYYAELDEFTWMLSQGADQDYQVVVRYIARPVSLVVQTTGTWLSENCSDLLFQCSLMEAENYLKADDRFGDIAGDYATKLQVARIELRNSIRQGDYSPVKASAETVQG